MINNDDFQTLETEIAETKKSVSDGKTLVAAAITRKDVTTAATDTFSKMASNIDSITTVQQGTADATAIAADLLSGKTAYKNGLKLIGSMANNGAVSTTIAGGVLKQGYTSGGVIANLVAGNVKQGVNIGGVVGNLKAFGERHTLRMYSQQAYSYTVPAGEEIAMVFIRNMYNGIWWHCIVPRVGAFYTKSVNHNPSQTFETLTTDTLEGYTVTKRTVSVSRDYGTPPMLNIITVS